MRNRVFACAALTGAATLRDAIDSGAADTTTALAFCPVDEIPTHLEAAAPI